MVESLYYNLYKSFTTLSIFSANFFDFAQTDIGNSPYTAYPLI